MGTKLEACNCPFCRMPRILSLAIEKRAFADPIPDPVPTRKISAVTAARQLSAESSAESDGRTPLPRLRRDRSREVP